MRREFAVRVQPRLELLEQAHREEIHGAGLRLLARTGVVVHHEQALHLLAEAGCRVDGTCVRIPEHVVERALATVPRSVGIHNRLGRPAMDLEDRKSYFGTGSDTPNVIDFDSGQRRPAVLADVARAARLADALPHLDFVMSMGLAGDVPVERSDRHHFAAMVGNSAKPIMFTAWSLEGLRDIYEMAAVVAGGEQQLRDRPFVIHYAMAIAPFVHPRDSLEKVLFCAEKGLPVEYHSVDIGGSTGPATLAGSFVQGNARMLSGLVIHQLKAPGAPLVVDTSVVFLDMATMVSPYVAPEVTLASLMNKEMALYYGVPTFAKAGAGDSKLLDQQAGVEIGMTMLSEYLIGNNLVHDLGYLESGMTSSLESLAICDEVAGLVKRIGRGVELSPEHLALEAIEETGPTGNYLVHPHTLRHFREELWFPKLMDRQNHDRWQQSGGESLAERAHRRAAVVLETHEPPPLDPGVLREIGKITKSGQAGSRR